MNRDDHLLTLDELCDLLRLKKSYVYKLTSRGLIPYYKLGGLRFRESEVMSWIENNKVKELKAKSAEDILRLK